MKYKHFNCFNIENVLSDDILKEITHIFYSVDVEISQIVIGERRYQSNLIYLESEVLLKIASKLWKQVEDVVLSTKNVTVSFLVQTQIEIMDILVACRECLLINKENDWPHIKEKFINELNLLRKSIFPLFELNENCLRKIVSSCEKQENSPAYFYLHIYLDVQWLLLCLMYLSFDTLNVVQTHIQQIMKALITLAATVFKKSSVGNLESVDPLVCSCIKRMWCKLWVFVEKLNKPFWKILDPSLQENDEIFVTWLICNIASLQEVKDETGIFAVECYSDSTNFATLEKQVKSFVTKLFNYEEMLAFLKHLDKLLNHWWKKFPKVDPYQILWDYFNKNLNILFTNNGALPKTAEQLISVIDKIISQQGSSSIEDCYEFFLHMLTKHLTSNPNHWPRIKGRIYSRLPLQKINEFNDCGLYHIIILFLSLQNCLDLDEITSKLLVLLENLSTERRNHHLVWNAYIVLIVQYDRKKISIEKIAEPLIQLTDSVADNRNLYHLLKLYIDGLKLIFKSNNTLSYDKSMLLSNWIFKYIIYCEHGDLCNLLNMLCGMVRKICEENEWSKWESAFRMNIIPALRQVALSSGAPAQIGELIALICQNNRDISNDCLTQFLEDTASPKIISQFLNFFLLDLQMLPKNQEIAIIQAWTRCSLLVPQFNENLTKRILRLSTISSCIDSDIVNNCSSLCCFIKALGSQTLSCKTSIRLKEICEICFGHVDKWINKYLAKPNSEALTVQIYTTLGILFYHCSVLLYGKGRSNCLLSRLSNALLLPSDVLIGKSLHIFILNAVQRTWHLYMQGIFFLEHDNDPYLERLMKDLVVRYLPHLQVTTSPMLKCLENENLCTFIFEKICLGFLTPSSKSAEDNTSKAVKLIMMALQSSSSHKQVELITKTTLRHVFQVIMFHTHKTNAIEFLKFLVCSEYYTTVKDTIRDSIVVVTEKHLAFNVNNLFQLLVILVKLIPQDVQATLPNIKKQVSLVEKMRGVGYDQTLRKHLDNIEKLLYGNSV